MQNGHAHNSYYHYVSGSALKHLTWGNNAFDPEWSKLVETAPVLPGSGSSACCP